MPQANDVHISASVGRNGVNQRDDVSTVQKLINDHLQLVNDHLPNSKSLHALDVDGVCGPLTIEGIEDVQSAFLRMIPPDGRVDPGGDTFRFLTGSGAPPRPHSGPDPLTQEVIDAAQASHTKWKIPASVTLAQWALESSWGRAHFRKFASLNEAFDQHGELLATARPYAHARTLVNDPNAFADALTGVYATDPNYGSLLKSLMRSHNLYQYD
jgi:hypothetical protein